jgi:hypothetical protein
MDMPVATAGATKCEWQGAHVVSLPSIAPALGLVQIVGPPLKTKLKASSSRGHAPPLETLSLTSTAPNAYAKALSTQIGLSFCPL